MEVHDNLDKLSRGLPLFLLNPPASSPSVCVVCRSSPAPHHFDNPAELVSLLLCVSSSELPTPPGEEPPEAFLCKTCHPQVATLLRHYEALTDILGNFHANRTRLTHTLTYSCAEDLKLPPSVADAAFFEWKCSLGTHLHLERGSFKGLMHPVLRPGKRRGASVGTQTEVPKRKVKKWEDDVKKREGRGVMRHKKKTTPIKIKTTPGESNGSSFSPTHVFTPEELLEELPPPEEDEFLAASPKTLTSGSVSSVKAKEKSKVTRKKKPPPPPHSPVKKKRRVVRKKTPPTSPKKKPTNAASTSVESVDCEETGEGEVEVPLPPKKRKRQTAIWKVPGDGDPSSSSPDLPATVKCLSPSCPVMFISFSRMLNHVVRKHDNNVPFQCDTCPKLLATRKDLIAHRRVHGIEKRYECKTCGGKFENPRSLKVHEASHSDVKFPCEICDKLCPSRSYLQTHMRLHTRFNTCPLCPSATFTIPSRFRRHNFLHHPPPSGKTCHVCYLHFEEDEAYDRHMSAHDHLKCPYCHRIFNAKNTLERHKLIHEDKLPYPCTHCNKSFRSAWRLTVHTYCHTGAHPFVCDQCGKRFPVGNVLKKHMKSAHPPNEDDDENKEGGQSK